MVDRVHAIAATDTDRVVETYRRLYPGASPADRLIATTTDSISASGHWFWRNGGPRSRRRRFGCIRSSGRHRCTAARMKAPHAMDVPFTFDTIDLTNATDGGDTARRLTATMSGVWAAFARDGVPDHPLNSALAGVPACRSAPHYLGRDMPIDNDPRGETRALWQDITGTN